jgi:hypothetical protein
MDRKGLLASGIAALLLAGCGGKFTHVRTGDDPRYQDDGVRFRTTYYFRVFDPCGSSHCSQADEDAGLCRPKNDSLYRFRLTGKAGSMASVHFEAGTLMAHEIDPFGVTVAYDEGSNRFQFKSRHKSDEEAKKREQLAEIRNLHTLCTELKSQTNAALMCEAALTTKVAALQPRGAPKTDDKLQSTDVAKGHEVPNEPAADAGKSGTSKGGMSNVIPTSAAETRSVALPQSYRNPDCALGDEKRRGFQILGPEGWRTFDQDERLLLAMSSSGKPLISTLKEISDRVLQQKSPAQQLGAYLREQSAVERARQSLDAAGDQDSLRALWDGVRAEMERKEP